MKKEDLKLIALEIMDLKFNRGGFDLTCEYMEKKLNEDGFKVKLNEVAKTGEFQNIMIDYSIASKREGIKEMVAHVVNTGEERGLNGRTKLGVWLNHAVESMALKIINDVLKDVEEIADRRIMSVYYAHSYQENTEHRDNNLVNCHKMAEMWERMLRNIKRIKYDSFRRFNKYAW